VDISYPVLYSGDNSYYLRRLWDKSYNQAGSLFLEGNNKSIDELHTIVYGHNMKNGSMFAPLKEYLNQDFFEENGGWFTLYTPEGIWRYQIFSVYQAAADDELYTVGFVESEEYNAFLKMLYENSLYETGVTVYSDDHVMTLSTCTDDGKNRIVVHARCAEQIQ
jgi:sortase B